MTVPTPTSGGTAAKASPLACTPIPSTASQNDIPGTKMTLHRMFIVVGLICMVLSAVGCFVNFASHLIWRHNLKEQRHLMRISILPFIFTICAWCSINFYGLGQFLDPIPKLYEVYCVVCFFDFMVQVLTPNEKTREDFYIRAPRMNRRNTKQIHDRGSLRWYRAQYYIVYQALFMILVITILEEVFYSQLCTTSKAAQHFSIIITILSFTFTITALMGLIRLYRRFRKDYQRTKLLRKFWTFKGFVWLVIHQQLILEIIRYTKVVKPTKYMSTGDFLFGIPEFMIVCEGFMFAFGYTTTLSGFQYRQVQRQNYMQVLNPNQAPDASVGSYLLEVIFPTDIFIEFGRAATFLFSSLRVRGGFDYTSGTGVGFKGRSSRDINQNLNPEAAAKYSYENRSRHEDRNMA